MTHFSQVFNNKVKPMGAIVASSLVDIEQILLIQSKCNFKAPSYLTITLFSLAQCLVSIHTGQQEHMECLGTRFLYNIL